MIRNYYLECPKCNYVSSSLSANHHLPCPNCNITGYRHIFPDRSAMKLLKMIAYFHDNASQRVDNLQGDLVNKLRVEVGREYDTKLVTNTAKEIQRIYPKRGASPGACDTAYAQMLIILQQRLSLQSDEEASRVLAPLVTYSDTLEEHKAVVILTCALLEKLFDDLLVLILSCKRIDWQRAVKKTENLNFPRRCEVFKREMGLTLETALAQCPVPSFLSEWREVIRKRNNFIHDTPYAIDIKIAKKAFKLAENAFSVFADLQNRFCVQTQGKAQNSTR